MMIKVLFARFENELKISVSIDGSESCMCFMSLSIHSPSTAFSENFGSWWDIIKFIYWKYKWSGVWGGSWSGAIDLVWIDSFWVWKVSPWSWNWIQHNSSLGINKKEENDVDNPSILLILIWSCRKHFIEFVFNTDLFLY